VFDGMPLKDYYESAVYTPYGVRIHLYHAAVAKLKDARIQAVPQERMINASQLRHHFEKNIAAGLEGSIARSTEIDGDVTDLRRGLKGGWYKHGRATVNQSIIWKIKAYETLDGRIIGIQQRRQLRADVPRTYNAAGHLQKVHAKSAYEPIESVGAFEVEYLDPATRERSTSQVNFGPGFALFERELLWMKRDTLIGKWVEFKHMPHGAKKDGGLRIGQLLRFRDDLSGALQ
jgi:hypothetical protein